MQDMLDGLHNHVCKPDLPLCFRALLRRRDKSADTNGPCIAAIACCLISWHVEVIEGDSDTQRAEELACRLEATEEEVLVLGQSLRQAEAAQSASASEVKLEQVPKTPILSSVST